MPLRVLALLPYPLDRVPGQRFRIEQWAPHLAREEVDVTFSSFLSARTMDILYRRGHVVRKVTGTLSGLARRIRERRAFGAYDVALVFRESTLLAPAAAERHLLRGVRWVLDFDDAIYLPPAHPPSPWLAWIKQDSKTDILTRLAHHVTVGNETLASHSRLLAKAVTVIPTTIDTDVYLPRPRRSNPRPIVGWSGSQTTLPYVRQMHETLRALRSRVDFELRVIGGELEMPGLDVTCIPWRADTEVEDLRRFDIGLMPLPDDPWTRGKCGLKALQYMALGIPPVVSPVGVNAEIVTDGIDGHHASTSEEWIDRLVHLLSHPEQRLRLGAEARRTIETRYSARVHAPRLARVLREASAR